MASVVDITMDSKDVPVELREGSIASNTKDVKAPTTEATAPNASNSIGKKTKQGKDGKKKLSSPKYASKHRKAKLKAGKKVIIDASSTSSDSDNSLATGASSDQSEDDSDSSSDAEEEIKSKSKSILKKRHDVKTKKKKPTKKSKQGKKATHAETSDSDSEDSNDLSDETADSGHGKRGKKQKNGTMQQELQELRRQVQQLQLSNPTSALSLGNMNGTYNPGSLTGMSLGNLGYTPGSLNFGSGFNNLGTLDPTGATLGGINGGLAHDQTMGLNRPPPSRPGLGRLAPRRPNDRSASSSRIDDGDSENDDSADPDGAARDSKHRRGGKRRSVQRLDFKRVDQVWDSTIHNYKLQDTAENTSNSRYDEYLFHVRRTFDWESKYKATIIDIKSKALREALQDVMGNLKGVSLVEDTPKLDPNMLFLYLEDIREHFGALKRLDPEGKTSKERKKSQKLIDEKRRHLKVLIKYLDKDYAQVKKSLYPLLENGLITFDLCWALWKPNTLAYTTTYGSVDEPRVFKVDVAEKHYSVLKGEFYYVEGKYFEYDGKQFGYGSLSEEISDFRGTRKISSLGCYPLKYHKEATQLRKDLIERGKKFVSLAGAHYKSHQGIGYYKKKKSVIKVNINGRIMIDPSTHRRNNPNYPISIVRPKDHDLLSDEDDSEFEGNCCGSGESDGGGGGGGGEGHHLEEDDDDQVKFTTKFIRAKNGEIQRVRIPKDEIDEDENHKTKLDDVPSKNSDAAVKTDGVTDAGDEDTDGKTEPPEFAEEEYLIASPVVLGFAFAEKLWLELSVSGVKEISWNESAYESLVLEPKTKDIVKALVESHKYHAAESIDDVIQGKGKGLVFVLHGPPGTGKTLTAEGISELLKCPLYNVSAGDLGTDSRLLDGELQKVLDICHAWGAILLLDEADVFLEKRNMHDIHRNALVSIFLRQLEYFQGILFLTTNRVETFDDAFQSRIHIALRYDELDTKAKKAIFKIFIDRVRSSEAASASNNSSSSSKLSAASTPSTGSNSTAVENGKKPAPTATTVFTEADYDALARHSLNGRQIKNTVRTAQALAVQRGEPLSMKHIAQFLDVLQSFERDLKGGTGYQDAMRSYF